MITSDARDSNAMRDKDGILDSRLVGQIVREKIDERGLTQVQLANALNINPTYLSALIAGRNNFAKSVIFKRLVAELGLSIEEVEYINPHLIVIHPDTPPTALAVPREKDRTLPTNMLSALSALKEVGIALQVTEDVLRSWMPMFELGKAPKSKEDCCRFIVMFEKWL